MRQRPDLFWPFLFCLKLKIFRFYLFWQKTFIHLSNANLKNKIMNKTIPYFIQIVAITYDGTNLLWDSNKRDFVGFDKDVPETDLTDLDNAQDFASKHCSNIFEVWAEFINLETNELTNIVKKSSEGFFPF